MIVTCGEAIIDLVPVPGADDPSARRPVLGGSLFNVALCLGRLGARAGYLWELSTDANGALLRQALEIAHVDMSGVRITNRTTPHAIVDLSGAEPSYDIRDPSAVMRSFDPGCAEDHPALRQADLLHTGSAVLALEPTGSAIEAFIDALPERIALSLDYNVRPPSIADLSTYRARLEALTARAVIAKASAVDLAILYEGQPVEAWIDRWRSAGVALVVVTRGASGVSAATASVSVSLPAREVEVVDPVGAGDAFAAGLLDFLQRAGATGRAALADCTAEALVAALDRAQEAAAVVCARRGAKMPWRHELSQQ